MSDSVQECLALMDAGSLAFGHRKWTRRQSRSSDRRSKRYGAFLADQSLREKRKTNLHGANVMRLQSDSPMIRCAGLFRSDSPTIRCADYQMRRTLQSDSPTIRCADQSDSPISVAAVASLRNCDEKKNYQMRRTLAKRCPGKEPSEGRSPPDSYSSLYMCAAATAHRCAS